MQKLFRLLMRKYKINETYYFFHTVIKCSYRYGANKADDIVGYYLTFDPFSKEYSQCLFIKHRKVLTTAGCVGYRIQQKRIF
jgi:hypothetical protein